MNENTFINIGIFLAIVVAVVIALPYYIVEPGYAAMHQRLGSIVGINKVPGFYFRVPLIDSITAIDTRICIIGEETTALSKDLQFVSIGVAINYRISDIEHIYNNLGVEFADTVIHPFAAESIKAVVAKYTAEDLIQLRHEAKDKVCDDLKKRLQAHCIDLVEFNFVHVDFSKAFLHSVENKQIAQQNALMSRNETARIEEEGRQSKIRADAVAYASRAQSDAESYALTTKRSSVTKELIELMKVEKWNGQLPKVMSGTTPMLKMDI